MAEEDEGQPKEPVSSFDKEKRSGEDAEWVVKSTEEGVEEIQETLPAEDGKGERRRRVRKKTTKTTYVQDTGEVDHHCPGCTIL